MRFFLSLALLFLAVQAKPLVITSVYPLYDFVSLIAENEVDVSLILPPNSDPHSFEPTPKDVVNITNADLFFYVSDAFESWVKKFVTKAKLAVAVSDAEHENHVHSHDRRNHGSHEESEDPHVWLDPEEVLEIIENVRESLVNLIPEKKDFFEKNAESLIDEIKNMDSQYKKIFESCKHKKVFFAGHNSFSGFAKRYNLQFVPITQSFSSTAEPSAKQIAKIVDQVRKSGTKFIYYDALQNNSVAKTIAKETGAEILPLFSVHSTSKDDFAKKIHYAEYMKRNYENLTEGLMCPRL
jgi:zinc transport system substrate-binding protein